MIRHLARARRTSRWLAAVLILFGLSGCDAVDPTPRNAALTPDGFVDVVVALREAEQEVVRETHADSVQAEFTRRRNDILEAHGVTADELRQFVFRHQNHPEVMVEAWERIAQRLGTRPSDPPEGRIPGEEIW